jgi:N-acetylmuramoyl-L-alanine amidase
MRLTGLWPLRLAATIAYVCSASLAAMTAANAQVLAPTAVAPPGSAAPITMAAAPAPIPAPTAAPAPVPVERALGGDTLRTRFVIGLEKSVQFQVFSLSNPNRVVVVLPDVRLQLPTHDGAKPVGLIKSFRGGLASAEQMRIVIDVTEPVIVASSAIEKTKDGKGHRLAIEIVPVEKSKTGKKLTPTFALGAASAQPPLPVPAMSPKRKAALAHKPIIVIDPGHGGHDSGAQKHGAIEKNVVLAFGLALREKLAATGRYKVVMTRDTDSFVDLDERLNIADRNQASLFIAVHADYAGSNARGATIFSLRDGVADDLKRSAKGEVAKNLISGKQESQIKKAEGDVGAVKGILEDLVGREVDATKDRSKLFAGAVIETMSDATAMRQSPDQQATFRVLKTAKFPSVLIELAYVTNKKDADNLKSDEWRSSVADSLVSAVDNYFNNKLAHLPM